MYYPDYGVAGTVSTPGTGTTKFELARYVAAVEIDQWMLASDLAIALADYVRTEIIYALSYYTDLNWFMGTGTGEFCKKTGLFKLGASDGVGQVVGDSGDDTFTKMIAKTTYYLAQALGSLPTWAHRASPKWYMHPSNFFNHLGVRDAGGMPFAQILLAEDQLVLRLAGLPARLVPVAPSVTAVSTCYGLLAALPRACRTYRHNRAVEFAWSDNLGEDKWLSGVSAVKCDVPLDMQVRVPSGVIQLCTHA
jgi:HK97 family phage major capsid protein